MTPAALIELAERMAGDEGRIFHFSPTEYRDVVCGLLAIVPRWLDIETAPRDGSQIMVSGGTFTVDTSWDMSPMKHEGPSICGWINGPWGSDGWRGENAEGHDNFWWYQPTHWMPLPSIERRGIDKAGGEGAE